MTKKRTCPICKDIKGEYPPTKAAIKYCYKGSCPLCFAIDQASFHNANEDPRVFDDFRAGLSEDIHDALKEKIKFDTSD